MQTRIEFNSLLVYSPDSKEYFYTEFGNWLNIVHWKNTSWKTTLIQSILYTLWINDSKESLSEIIDLWSIFRLNITIIKNSTQPIKLAFIRENQNLIIKEEGKPKIVFTWINWDNSEEHKKLKIFLHNIFNFSLNLETKNGYIPAPIETILLPYYIAQSTWWVYIGKSFSNLEFYRNFKEDFLDYYLWVSSSKDNLEKHKLQQQKKQLESERNFYLEINKWKQEIEISKALDEEYLNKTNLYVEEYSWKQNELFELDKDFIELCNALSFSEERYKFLKRNKKNLTSQDPRNSICPLCKNQLEKTLENIYSYLQDRNDTENEIVKISEDMKRIKSNINSLNIKRDKLRNEISSNYNVYRDYNNWIISIGEWVDNKVNIQLIKEAGFKIVEIDEKIKKIEEDLKEFKTDQAITTIRRAKEAKFKSYFLKSLEFLNVVKSWDWISGLYSLYLFPLQWVELHKAILAYNFCLNKLIAENSEIHRMPFILDAIFKEDIEWENKEKILEYIQNNLPTDTQTIIAIAESKKDKDLVSTYNQNFFWWIAKLINIGWSEKERAFLAPLDNSDFEPILDTVDIIYW